MNVLDSTATAYMSRTGNIPEFITSIEVSGLTILAFHIVVDVWEGVRAPLCREFIACHLCFEEVDTITTKDPPAGNTQSSPVRNSAR